MFAKLSLRDTEVFSRQLLEAHFRINAEQERYELFYGTEIRARHTNNFIYTFEKLLKRATEVDVDNMIRDSVAASTHSFVYNLAKSYQTMAPAELADYKITGKSINF